MIAGCARSDDIPPPSIATLMPSHASSGSVVTILGQSFCQNPDTEDPLACASEGSVLFGSAPGQVGMYSDQMITAEVPALAPGRVGVTVVVSGRGSNRVDFVVDP